MGEEVTWEARLGVRQRLTPHHFRNSQVRGAFCRFDYESPVGWLGRVADHLFLEAYRRRFLETRGAILKAAAESALASVRRLKS